MDYEPPNLGSLHLDNYILLLSFSELLIFGVLLLFLIICSALISGSEVAFFSLSPQDEHRLDEDDSLSSDRIADLKSKPRTLLATILVTNNLVNIAIVVVSTFMLRSLIGVESYNNAAQFLEGIFFNFFTQADIAWGLDVLVTVVLVTFILVLFGEVAPKIYANLNNVGFAKRMALPLIVLTKIFGPISSILVGWTNYIEGKVDAQKSSVNASKDVIDKAIDLATQQTGDSSEQVDILKGIIKFGDVAAKQVMKPRVDVVALPFETKFSELLAIIKDAGYSRIPVYKEDFDQLAGILYVKDLLGYSDQNDDFVWQTLIRENILYVPEFKKIDDLMKEFQSKRTHMGIVVDEYGGAAGIITLEDIMEEVIGEIKDEFDDDDEIDFVKLGPNNYIFEGKTLINDFCRSVDEDTEVFTKVLGDASSLAGLLLEMEGAMPKIEKEITYKHFKFKVISVSKRRIEKINVLISK